MRKEFFNLTDVAGAIKQRKFLGGLVEIRKLGDDKSEFYKNYTSD